MSDPVDNLLAAYLDGKVDIVRSILASGAIPNNYCGFNGQSLLSFAVWESNWACVKASIDAGMDFRKRIKIVDTHVGNLLHLAILRNVNASEICEGLAVLFDPLEKTSEGYTALHLASALPGGEVFSAIVEHSWLAIDEQDFTGRTALMVACESGHLNIVEKLIFRSDINILDSQGRDILHYAKNSSNSKCEEYVRRILLMIEEGRLFSEITRDVPETVRKRI